MFARARWKHVETKVCGNNVGPGLLPTLNYNTESVPYSCRIKDSYVR